MPLHEAWMVPLILVNKNLEEIPGKDEETCVYSHIYVTNKTEYSHLPTDCFLPGHPPTTRSICITFLVVL